ncbi:unnamed protein product [Brassica oleracea var. botrytis]
MSNKKNKLISPQFFGMLLRSILLRRSEDFEFTLKICFTY